MHPSTFPNASLDAGCNNRSVHSQNRGRAWPGNKSVSGAGDSLVEEHISDDGWGNTHRVVLTGTSLQRRFSNYGRPRFSTALRRSFPIQNRMPGQIPVPGEASRHFRDEPRQMLILNSPFFQRTQLTRHEKLMIDLKRRHEEEKSRQDDSEEIKSAAPPTPASVVEERTTPTEPMAESSLIGAASSAYFIADDNSAEYRKNRSARKPPQLPLPTRRALCPPTVQFWENNFAIAAFASDRYTRCPNHARREDIRLPHEEPDAAAALQEPQWNKTECMVQVAAIEFDKNAVYRWVQIHSSSNKRLVRRAFSAPPTVERQLAMPAGRNPNANYAIQSNEHQKALRRLARCEKNALAATKHTPIKLPHSGCRRRVEIVTVLDRDCIFITNEGMRMALTYLESGFVENMMSAAIPRMPLQLNTLYVTQNGGGWYRVWLAEDSPSSAGRVHVISRDYGWTQWVDASLLRVCPEELALPPAFCIPAAFVHSVPRSLWESLTSKTLKTLSVSIVRVDKETRVLQMAWAPRVAPLRILREASSAMGEDEEKACLGWKQRLLSEWEKAHKNTPPSAHSIPLSQSSFCPDLKCGGSCWERLHKTRRTAKR